MLHYDSDTKTSERERLQTTTRDYNHLLKFLETFTDVESEIDHYPISRSLVMKGDSILLQLVV